MITSLRDMEKLAEGIEQGIAISREKYLQQGREEVAREFMLNMFDFCTIEQIAEVVDKTIEEVLEFQKQHNLGQGV